MDEDFKLDQAIIRHRRYQNQLSNGDGSFLAWVIRVLRAEGCDSLDKKYEDPDFVDDLLDEGHSLKTILAACRKSGKYAEIRSHPKLQAAIPVGRSKLPRLPINMLAKVHSVKSAWAAKYKGTLHYLFYEALCNMWIEGKNRPYGNQVAIVQSSGYGKSRMVHELSTLVFTIPFCLRDPEESTLGKGFAYPFSDESIHSYLINQYKYMAPSQYAVECSYLSLLRHIFTGSMNIIRNHVTNNGRFETAQELAAWWSKYLIRNRDKFYDASVALAHADKISWEKQTQNVKAGSNGLRERTAQAEYTKKALEELLATVEASSKESKEKAPPVRAIMYFDEVHELSIKLPCQQNQIGGKRLYDVLATCLDTFMTIPMMIVSMSTVSILDQLAAPIDTARPVRINSASATLRPPWTAMPFDTNKTMILPGEMTLQEISEIPFLAEFGRPLFGCLLEHKQTSEDILSLAKTKIIQADILPGVIPVLESHAKIALLDIQLMLNYEPRYEETQSIQEKLIAGHMGTAISIPTQRKFLRSIYTSEPLLAEAAAQLTNTINIPLINTLHDQLVVTQYLDRGEIGELGARVMLLSAYHSACKAEQSNRSVNYSFGCTLRSFFRALFREPYAEGALQSKPDNIPKPSEGDDHRPSLDEVLGNAKIRFTHFIKSEDETGTSQAGIYAAFLRGAGVICENPAADLVLPVLVWDTKICVHVMTCIAISIKPRAKSGSALVYAIQESRLCFFPTKFESCCRPDSAWKCDPKPPLDSQLDIHSLPFISLILDIGVDTMVAPTGEDASKIEVSRAGTTGPPRAAKKSVIHQHARYNILAKGCSDQLFGPINGVTILSWRNFLQFGKPLSDHPRQGEEIHGVLQMKPYFKHGPDSYHWVCNEQLGGQDVEEYQQSDAFTFMVGSYELDDL